jgi:hypothetical protein
VQQQQQQQQKGKKKRHFKPHGNHPSLQHPGPLKQGLKLDSQYKYSAGVDAASKVW